MLYKDYANGVTKTVTKTGGGSDDDDGDNDDHEGHNDLNEGGSDVNQPKSVIFQKLNQWPNYNSHPVWKANTVSNAIKHIKSGYKIFGQVRIPEDTLGSIES